MGKTEDNTAKQKDYRRWTLAPKDDKRFLLFSPQYFRILNEASFEPTPLEIEVGGLIFCPTLQSIGEAHLDSSGERRFKRLPRDVEDTYYYPIALFLFNTLTSEMYISEVRESNLATYRRKPFDGLFNPQFGADLSWVAPLNGGFESVTLPAQALLPAWWEQLTTADPETIKSFSAHLKDQFVIKRHCLYDPHFCIFSQTKQNNEDDEVFLRDIAYLNAKPKHQYMCIGPTQEESFQDRMTIAKADIAYNNVLKSLSHTAEGKNKTIGELDDIDFLHAVQKYTYKLQFSEETLVDVHAITKNSAAARIFIEHACGLKGSSELERCKAVTQSDNDAIHALKICMIQKIITDDMALFHAAAQQPSVFGITADYANSFGANASDVATSIDIEKLSKSLEYKGYPGVNFLECKGVTEKDALHMPLYLDYMGRHWSAFNLPQGTNKTESYQSNLLYHITSAFLLKNIALLKKQASA